MIVKYYDVGDKFDVKKMVEDGVGWSFRVEWKDKEIKKMKYAFAFKIDGYIVGENNEAVFVFLTNKEDIKKFNEFGFEVTKQGVLVLMKDGMIEVIGGVPKW